MRSTALLCLLAALPAHATWSVIATDTRTGQVGAAVTSCVGALDLTIAISTAPGFGVVDAQATFDPSFKGRNLAAEKLRAGEAPADILRDITDAGYDDDAGVRQFAVVDLAGRAAAFTGNATLSWSGDRQRNDGRYAWSAQGNILTSEKVVNQTSDAFQGCDLAARLMNAIEAGQANGEGDRRCTPNGLSADSAILEVLAPDGGLLIHLDVTATSPSSAVTVIRPQFDAWRAQHPCPLDRVPETLTPARGCSSAGGLATPALLLLLSARRRCGSPARSRRRRGRRPSSAPWRSSRTGTAPGTAPGSSTK
ncbi:MAG: DUF1028 domain-containing protein [Myxococcaceae bacterium]